MLEEVKSPHAQHIVGVGGIVIRNHRVLMVKHNYGVHKGCWVLPGGHVNYAENLDVAVEREVLEETGITAVARGVVAVRSQILPDFGLEVYIVFLMDYVSGVETVCPRENDAVSYFTREEVVNEIQATPLSRAILDRVMSLQFSFFSLQSDYKQNGPDYRFYL